MLTFLQFLPHEYRAIVRACRPLDLDDASFPAFKDYLFRALADDHPALAERVAKFHTFQAGIVYEHLRERRREAGLLLGDALNAAEVRAVQQVCRSLVAQPRFLASLRQLLVHRFRTARPGLARKLSRLSDRQVERLYKHSKQGKGRA